MREKKSLFNLVLLRIKLFESYIAAPIYTLVNQSINDRLDGNFFTSILTLLFLILFEVDF